MVRKKVEAKDVNPTPASFEAMPLENIMELRDNVYIRDRIDFVRRSIDDSYFELAGLLYRAFDLGAHKSWGFSTWKEYVEKDVGMSLRKVQFLISIWDWFYVQINDRSIKEKLKGIGWTKVKEMVGVVTPENADEWIDKANSMNAVDFAEQCRMFKKGVIDGDDEGGEGGGGSSKGESTKRMTFTFMGDQAATVEDALDMAKDVTGSDKKGNLIALICTDYLASNIFQNKKSSDMKSLFLAKIEALMDVRIIAHSTSGEGLIYGKDNIIDARAE